MTSIYIDEDPSQWLKS